MTTPEPTRTAGDFMETDVETVRPETPLPEIIEHLLHRHVSNVPVVEENDGKPSLVGFISEADCMEHLANQLFYGNPAPALTAEMIMKRHPVCVATDANIFTLASIFIHHQLRHLPVVEEDRLLGIVSRRDVLEELDKYCRDVARRQDQEHRPPDLREVISHRFIARGR